MITRAQAEEYRNNPNVRAFLDAIAEAEGTTKHGYATMFGGSKLTSLQDHPRKALPFTETTGKKNQTTAAGRYQFLQRTWDDLAPKLALTDFGPVSQDIAAIALLDRAGALQNVLAGDLQGAAKKAGKTWASLPSSPYAQPKKSQAAFDRILAKVSSEAGTLPAVASTAVPAPPVSAGGALVPVINQPADAVAAAFDQYTATKPPSYLAEIEAIQRAPSPDVEAWEQGMMKLAVEDDAQQARNEALAQFFNEPVVPSLAIPESIDESINRYLARLS